MNEQEDAWLWIEQVAELLGVKPATIRHYTTQANARKRRAGPWEFPRPGRYQRRKTATGGARSPQWLRSVIIEHRDAERPRKRVPAGRPAGGQYAAKRRRVA